MGPVANPIEMGNTHERMVETIAAIPGYRPYFAEAFGSDEVTKDRIAKALADYERTRIRRQGAAGVSEVEGMAGQGLKAKGQRPGRGFNAT